VSKITDKQKDKRISILDSAYDLFISKSFYNTSIDDVVKKAGVAKGTFYLYFKDKYDLMDRIVIRKSLDVLKSALNQLEVEKKKNDNNLSFSQQMLFLVSSIVDYMQNNKEFVMLIDKKLFSSLGAFRSIEDQSLRESIDLLIDENIQNGISREETLRVIYVIVDMVGVVCCDAIIYESPFRLNEIKPTLLSAVEKILE
jgi:AcrR family transcriptional regulator